MPNCRLPMCLEWQCRTWTHNKTRLEVSKNNFYYLKKTLITSKGKTELKLKLILLTDFPEIPNNKITGIVYAIPFPFVMQLLQQSREDFWTHSLTSFAHNRARPFVWRVSWWQVQWRPHFCSGLPLTLFAFIADFRLSYSTEQSLLSWIFSNVGWAVVKFNK